MKTVKAFSLSQNRTFNTFLDRYFHGAVIYFDSQSELLKTVIKSKYQTGSLFLIFLDNNKIEFSEVLSLITRLVSIHPSLCYLLHVDKMDEGIGSLVHEVAIGQAMVLSGDNDYAEFSQAIAQLFKISSLSHLQLQTQKQLDDSDKQFKEQQLLFNDLFGLIKYNGRGEIVEANQLATELIGRHASQMIGTDIFQVFPSFKRDERELNKSVISGEERYIDSHGLQKWAQITVKEYQEGHQIMYALVLQDITTQKDQARNFQFQLFDESLKKARSELAHNLGNTLNSMNSTQTVLKRGVKSLTDLSEYTRRWVTEKSEGSEKQQCIKFVEAVDSVLKETISGKLEESNKAMDSDLKLLTEILSMEDLETTHFTDEEINIYNLAQALIRSTKAYCEEHDVGVRLLDSNTKLLLRTSRNLLHQALLNLIKNAVESLTSTDITPKLITIQTLTRSDQGVSILVRDNGEGIAEENLDKVFQLGFTTKASGTGQGLHSIANYVNQYGGSVDVSSELGRGTCFEIHFPKELVSWL